MTYSLNTLNASAAAKDLGRSVAARFGHEMALIAGCLGLIFWLLALLSYSPHDVGWSHSGPSDVQLIANWAGRLGAMVADASYFFLGFSVWWGVAAALHAWFSSLARWMRAGDVADAEAEHPLVRRIVFWVGLVLLLTAGAGLEWSRLYRFEDWLPGQTGGIVGQMVGPMAVRWLGFTGSGLISIVAMVAGAAMVFRFSWGHVAEFLGARIDAVIHALLNRREVAKDLAQGRKAARERAAVVPGEHAKDVAPQVRQEVQTPSGAPVMIEPVLMSEDIAPLPKKIPVRESTPPWVPEPSAFVEVAPVAAPMAAALAPALPPVVTKERIKPPLPAHGVVHADSRLPQVDLLDGPQLRQETVAPETLEMTSRLIEKKLKDFGVQVRVVAAMPGPVITRYEIEPATGVKGSQIVGLAKDLARSLSLTSIRVVETIPGKNFMALELPNAKRQSIRLSEILGSQVYHDGKSMLTMGLGKDIVGNPIVADLSKMPHVLVAGTTGSGKSVGINAMILSLLYKAEARDVRLLMIDPKMLEMSVYEGIPHLLAPVVTDMKQAAHGLNWCVAEMERRYKLMSKLGVRNLAGYNTKIDEAQEREEFIYNPFSLNPEQPEPLTRLPHIVVVIDELADLMMVVGKKIEELIARLAQKARAAGIHLILATQRPSVDVITGLIKANIPTRIAFQVSSKIDSRTILDQMGAEALLGMGDMLYMPSGTGLPIRVHGAFVSDEEVHRVVSYLKTQGEPDYIEGVLEGGTVEGDGDVGVDGGEGGEKDPLYDQAVEIVLKDRKASISYVQRKLRIGYNRSARLLEDMEKAGLISGLTSSGQRELLVPARGGD